MTSEGQAAEAEKAHVRAIFARTKPEDFDGHTEVERMTPLQRWQWLDRAVLFIAAQRQRNEALQVAEEPKDSYKAK